MGEIKIIQKIVAEAFKISDIELISHRRSHRIIPARHIAMYLCRILTDCSYPKIAREFDNRDHTSVIHGEKNAKILIEDNPYYSNLTNEIIMRYKKENT